MALFSLLIGFRGRRGGQRRSVGAPRPEARVCLRKSAARSRDAECVESLWCRVITLDIDEPQVCLHYADSDFSCHHHDLEFLTLTDFIVVPLSRASPLPARVAGDFYGFDPIAQRDLERLLVDAQALGRVVGILGTGGPTTATAPRWVVADPAHERFGEVLPASLIMDADRFVARGPMGLAEIGAGATDWVFAECVAEAGNARSRPDLAGLGRDHRVLLVSRDRRGVRRLSLSVSLQQFRQQSPSDWPFRGPKAIVEYLDVTTRLGWNWRATTATGKGRAARMAKVASRPSSRTCSSCCGTSSCTTRWVCRTWREQSWQPVAASRFSERCGGRRATQTSTASTQC